MTLRAQLLRAIERHRRRFPEIHQCHWAHGSRRTEQVERMLDGLPPWTTHSEMTVSKEGRARHGGGAMDKREGAHPVTG